MNGDTVLFDVSEVNEKLIKDTLNSAIIALEEKGYNPINQLVGYIISTIVSEPDLLSCLRLIWRLLIISDIIYLPSFLIFIY